MAFIPAFAGDTARGLELVDAAQQHCWYGVTPLARSWLHCVASEAIARSADPAGYRRHIDLAENALSTDGMVPEWFDFYDASRLNGFAGYCALAAGDNTAASARLQSALDDLAPTAAKQRTVLLADLATAHLDDAGHAAALVDQALDVLTGDWYATGHQRIGQVAHRLPAGADKDRVVKQYRALAKGRLVGQALSALCLATSSGNSASESNRNRHRSRTAWSSAMYPHGPRRRNAVVMPCCCAGFTSLSSRS